MIDGELRSLAHKLAQMMGQIKFEEIEMIEERTADDARLGLKAFWAHDAWHHVNTTLYAAMPEIMQGISGMADEQERAVVRARYFEQTLLGGVSDPELRAVCASMLWRHELAQRVWNTCAPFIQETVLKGIPNVSEGMIRAVIMGLIAPIINAQQAAAWRRHPDRKEQKKPYGAELVMWGSGEEDYRVRWREDCNTVRLIHPKLDELPPAMSDVLMTLLYTALSFEQGWFLSTVAPDKKLIDKLDPNVDGWLLQVLNVGIPANRFNSQLSKDGYRETMVFLGFDDWWPHMAVTAPDTKKFIQDQMGREEEAYRYDWHVDDGVNWWKFAINIMHTKGDDTYQVAHGLIIPVRLDVNDAYDIMMGADEVSSEDPIFYFDAME